MNENTDNKARLIEVCNATLRDWNTHGAFFANHLADRIDAAGLLSAIPKDPTHDCDPHFNAWIDLDPEATMLEVLWAKKGWDAHKALLAGSVGVYNPAYHLVYADQDISDEVFWIEGEPEDTRKGAIEAFKLRSRNWSCKLFMEIADHRAPDALTRSPEPKGRWIPQSLIDELDRAVTKFPTWPTDPIHAVAVLGEEFGELTKDVLQSVYEPHKTTLDNVRKEAVQTAAMALRFLASLDKYEYKPGEQHEQTATAPRAKEE